MLTPYIHAALRHARYEILDGTRFYAEIPEMPGVWAQGDTLEKCRDELIEVVEGWLFLKIKDGDQLPVLDGIDLNLKVSVDAE